jgi:putative transposase
VEPEHPNVPIVRQCRLLDLARASFYYEPEGETDLNLMLMRMIDREFLRHPFYGARRMGLMAIYPKPRLSFNGLEHKVYSYLLKGLPIDIPDKVWATDITYIRPAHGFVYLVAVIDWHSRSVADDSTHIIGSEFDLISSRRRWRINMKFEIRRVQNGVVLRTELEGEACRRQGIQIEYHGRTATPLRS